MSYNDRTYCGSPDCHNECGRKMSDEDKELLKNTLWKNPESYPFVS
jgi:hypothetical protein